MRPRKPDPCHCPAYQFPHRVGSGECERDIETLVTGMGEDRSEIIRYGDPCWTLESAMYGEWAEEARLDQHCR